MSEGLITKGLMWSVWLLTSAVCVGNAALSRHEAQLFAFRFPFRITGLMPMQVPGEVGIGVAVPLLSVGTSGPDVGRSIRVPVKPVGSSFWSGITLDVTMLSIPNTIDNLLLPGKPLILWVLLLPLWARRLEHRLLFPDTHFVSYSGCMWEYTWGKPATSFNWWPPQMVFEGGFGSSQESSRAARIRWFCWKKVTCSKVCFLVENWKMHEWWR